MSRGGYVGMGGYGQGVGMSFWQTFCACASVPDASSK